jgi:hypothetical protein
MSDHWPLLVSDPLDGDRLLNRQLRPRAAAVPVDRSDFTAAREAIVELCGSWGGAGMPLMPVTPGSEVDEEWSRILNESNIDGIQRSQLLSQAEREKYSDVNGPSPGLLLRVVVDLERKPVVQTCRGVPEDDPWFLAYLAVLGDLPRFPDSMNTWNDLRRDLTYQDVLTIRSVDHGASAAGLLDLLRDYTAMSAVDLTRVQLSGGLQATYNMDLFPEQSRFEWDDDRIARQYGPNIVVVYQPGSVEDLALIWNLRARFAHPPKFPLGLPLTQTTESDLQRWVDSGADHHFGGGHNLALTSFSVPSTDLSALGNTRQFETVDPWQVLRPIGGYCVMSTEIARFSRGRTNISSFSPIDLQAIGQSYLGSHLATWMKLKTTVFDDPLPLSPTMRRGQRYFDPNYLDGQITTGGKLSGFTTIRQPTGLAVMAALGADKGVRLTESSPGQAAEQLIRAAGPRLSMFASPGAVKTLSELTRGRHVSIVRRRLNQFLADPTIDETTDRYQVLFDRLDKALGDPDIEEVGYMRFDRLRALLRMPEPAAKQWVQWALAARLVLRGVEAKCTHCGQKQWRPLSEAVPVLTCHGCGHTIEHPHGFNHIEYRYRASEILLRAMSHDVLPCVLSMRYVSSLMGGKQSVFGAYPGVEFRLPGSADPDGEADVLVVLRNGGIILGECKANARGLKAEELDKLWRAAELIGARATFAATLDRASNCEAEWRHQSSPSGRPHFALTAEHLFDLGCIPPVAGQDLFDWKDDYPPGPDLDADRERLLVNSFNDYVQKTGEDDEQPYREPWMTRNE